MRNTVITPQLLLARLDIIMIQVHAVDRLIEQTEHIMTEHLAHKDAFAPERRYEMRLPEMQNKLASFMQSYTRNIESAQAILQFLETHFVVNAEVTLRICWLCQKPDSNQ
jgi:hypothetical protein